MSLLGTLRAAWTVTTEGSRALSAARDAYRRGEAIPGIVAAWAANTETPVDDGLAESLARWLTVAATWAQRAALLLVQASVRLEIQAPALVARFVHVVDALERRVPPLLARLRAAADRAQGGIATTRAGAQRASVAASQLAAALGRLKGAP